MLQISNVGRDTCHWNYRGDCHPINTNTGKGTNLLVCVTNTACSQCVCILNRGAGVRMVSMTFKGFSAAFLFLSFFPLLFPKSEKHSIWIRAEGESHKALTFQKHQKQWQTGCVQPANPHLWKESSQCLDLSVEASSWIQEAADTLPLSQAFDKWALMNPNLHRDLKFSMGLYFISCFELLLKEHIFNLEFLTENAVQM